uniref:Ion transport domain-containing protein n=1 Tax=Maylandia zebra TaxID=106582 RepID=A0A3P9ARU7_9CICH
MVSLLPPVGTEVFRHFTTASQEVQQQHVTGAKDALDNVTQKNLPKPAAHLETGKSLPLIYGDLPPQLLNIPLEDLDPFYQSRKTFMVLSKGNIINRFSADSSCYLLSPFNPLRTLDDVDKILICLIILHSLYNGSTLLSQTRCVPEEGASIEAVWKGYVYMAIFVFEALVKVVARGFCVGRFTFLRDPWNWLDIIIISTL